MSSSAPRSSKSLTTSGGRNQQLVLIIIAVAVVIGGLFILMSLNGARSSFGPEFFSDIPQTQLADGGWVLGNPEAPVTIVEFADYLCPACQSYKPTMDQFITEMVATGKARYEYRTLITAGAGRTEFLSQLTECSQTLNPGSLWFANEAMYELAITGQGRSSDTARQFADKVGLSVGDLLTCARDANQYETDVRLANQNGASSTPSLFYRVNNGPIQPITGDRSFNSLTSIVEAFS
jgi:protein-disulfide isomerase